MKIQSTSRLVMSIKNELEKAKDDSGTDAKYKQLQSEFIANCDRLRECKTMMEIANNDSLANTGDATLLSDEPDQYVDMQLLIESHKEIKNEPIQQLSNRVTNENEISGAHHLDKAAQHQQPSRRKQRILRGVLRVCAIIVTIIIVL